MVKLQPAALWASKARVGCGTVTKAEEPRCRLSLQEPSLTMEAVLLERAVASIWPESLVHKTQCRRICGSEIARSQQSRSVLVRSGKGGSQRESTGVGDVRRRPVLTRRNVWSGLRVTEAGRRGPSGGMVR